MQLDYSLMHGAGNRILVIDGRGRDVAAPDSDTVRHLGDASTGPGFDQLIWVTAPSDPALDAGYRIFNADGSEVEQCGNGVRCLAWSFARLQPDKSDYRFESPAGVIVAHLLGDGRVSVSMAVPEFEPGRIPFLAEQPSAHYALDVDGNEFDVAVVSMGNPHCVMQVADVEAADVAGLGPAIENHPRFPARTNVGFMAVRSRKSIDLRVHERGVGETGACGTGACAAVVAGQRLGLLDDEVRVNLPGGQLMVSWRGGTEPVWLTGPAELISEGSIDL